jgi:CHASE2 domain-containing sensor protein
MRVERLKRKPVPCLLSVAALGIFMVGLSPLGQLSYDLSQELKPATTISNLVVIYANEQTVREFGDGHGGVSRLAHTRLLDQLTAQGARLVFYDFFFSETNRSPTIDRGLGTAIRQQGSVILTASGETSLDSGVALERVFPPADIFRDAARAWGHAEIVGNVAREIPRNFAGTPSAVWVAAASLQPDQFNPEGSSEVRWLNYYGPPEANAFAHYCMQDLLVERPGTLSFTNQVVFIGQRISTGHVSSAKDTFATPYSSLGHGPVPGVDIHATAFLNLMRHDWLRQVPIAVQCLAAALWGGTITGLLYWLSRGQRTVLVLAALSSAVALIAVSLFLQWHFYWWWSWLGPAFGQTALAFGWVLKHPRPDPYVAFISYRHQEDGSTALLLRDHLAKRGYKAFIDVKSLTSGHFDEQLLRELDSSSFFILILSPTTLARCTEPGDWVFKEFSHALQRKKTIIPVFKEGFRFDDKDGVPDLPEIKELSRFHGLQFRTDDFEGFANQLMARLKLR